MLIKLLLALISCFATIGCSFPSQSKPLLKSTDIEPDKNIERVSKNSEQNNNDSTRANYITLESEGKFNGRGNPIYKLRLYIKGIETRSYDTVSGRTHTQNRNRNKAGTEAPLPDGKYKVARTPIPGTILEAGDLFLPIQPLFWTGRSALGIHYDPSYEKANGEDRTSGCVALTSKKDLNDVLEYVRTFKPKYFEVNIQ